MFCIIKGRLKRIYSHYGHILKTAYLRGFLIYLCYYVLFSIVFLFLICNLHLQFCFPFAILSSNPFVSIDPFFVFFAAIVSIQSVFWRSAHFSFQPEFLERPSLCLKNSGWIYTFQVLYKTFDRQIVFFFSETPGAHSPLVRRSLNAAHLMRRISLPKKKSSSLPLVAFSPLFVNYLSISLKETTGRSLWIVPVVFLSMFPAQPFFMFDTRSLASARCNAARDRM